MEAAILEISSRRYHLAPASRSGEVDEAVRSAALLCEGVEAATPSQSPPSPSLPAASAPRGPACKFGEAPRDKLTALLVGERRGPGLDGESGAGRLAGALFVCLCEKCPPP